jgi:aryl-alcohol dehydrogenase-like predicted oxidoreductase
MSELQLSSANRPAIGHRLALGTAQFGLPYGVSNSQGQVSLATAKDMVGFIRNFGLDTIDTAIGYGESEQVLGKVGITDFNVVSKLLPLPATVNDAGEWAQSETEASLDRLKIDGLYGLLLHRSSDLSGPHGSELYKAMRKLRNSGKVKKIGISIYSPAELNTFAGKFDFDLIQAPFNLIDKRLQDSGWLGRLKGQGCEVHVRSTFLQGLLLMPRSAIPVKFGRWGKLWDKWSHWLQHNGEDAVHACLAYPLSFPEVDRVVVGANDLVQLRHIMAAASREPKFQFPDLVCDDEALINPAKWSSL